MIFAGSIGHIDGSVQAAGTQIANDIVGSRVALTDKQKTLVSKGSMMVFIALAAVLAYFTNGMDRLQLLAQISYQAVVQISVPLFLGIFFKFGNKNGALAGMIVGFACAAVLTVAFPDDIPALGSITGGVVALAINLIVYVAVSKLTKTSPQERARVDELFAVAADGERAVVAGGTTVPGMAAVSEGVAEREVAAGCAGAAAVNVVASRVATCGNAASVMIRKEPADASGGLAAGKVAGAVSAAREVAAGCAGAGAAAANAS